MSVAAHSPAPWVSITGRNGLPMGAVFCMTPVGSRQVAVAVGDAPSHHPEADGSTAEIMAANARRIVACVNVLAGIPTEDLERITALEPYLRLLKVSHLADRQAATFEGHPDHEYVAAGGAR